MTKPKEPIILYHPVYDHQRVSNSLQLLIVRSIEISKCLFLIIQMKNYIVRSYRDVIVIVITKFAPRRASKAQSIVMY